jgi:proteic killer suppression protein
VIRSFRHKGLRKFWEDDATSGLHGSVDRVSRILDLLDAARVPEDMNVIGFYFHRLAGKPVRYSVRVTANWRITFEWDGDDALRVDLEDYH